MQVLLPTGVLVPLGAGVLVVLVLLVALLVRAHRRRRHAADVDGPDTTVAPERPTVAHAVAIREADTAPLPISSATVLARSESARAAGAVPVEDVPYDVVPDAEPVDASTTALPQVPVADAASTTALPRTPETGDDASTTALPQVPVADAASTTALPRTPETGDIASTTALLRAPAPEADETSATPPTPEPATDDTLTGALQHVPVPEVDAASTTAVPRLTADEPQPPEPEPEPVDPPVDEVPDTTGSNVAFASAVSQVLAARAAAGRGPAPAEAPPPSAPPMPSKRGDTRDRLLAVLLDDPARAVGAARDLELCTTQLARLRAAVTHEREVLGTVLGRLTAAGLRPEQVAQLSGMEAAELDRLLNRS